MRASWILVGLISCFCLAPLRAQTLQLVDGRVLLATVEEADGDGLRVHRLDNGGTLDLRWRQLTPECVQRIKLSMNLVAKDQDELTVHVHEVGYVVNGGNQAVIGKLIDGEGANIVVQNKGVQFKIPRSELRYLKQVEVPVTQVFTRDEYYSMRVAELQLGDEGDKHVTFAEELIRVRDYAHAAEHLKKAKELKNCKDPARLDGMIERLTRYQESKKERDLLDQIQISRQRGEKADFDRGTKFIEQYEKEYPQGKLKTEFEAEKKVFAEARTRLLTQQIADSWRRQIQYVSEKKVLENDLTLAQAKEYAETKMTDEIVGRLATQFALPAAEIKRLWSDRAKYPVGKRAEYFAYGIGSWVLGAQAILKNTKQGKEQSERPPKDAAQDREIEKIAKAIRQAMERKRAAQGQGQKESEEMSDEDWWRDAGKPERSNWLRAYYAESGGQLAVVSAYATPCHECFGEGSVNGPSQDGKVQKVKCFLCHGTRYVRGFQAY